MIIFSILSMFVGLSSPSFAAADLGVEISPVIIDGKPRLGVSYASQYFGLTVSIPSSSLALGSDARVFAHLVEKSSGALYSDLIWQRAIAAGQPAESTYVAMAGLRGSQADSVRSKLKNLVFVLTVAGAGVTKTVHIDLAAFCKTNPGSFVNLDTGTKGCE